jgi:hypothetical protein
MRPNNSAEVEAARLFFTFAPFPELKVRSPSAPRYHRPLRHLNHQNRTLFLPRRSSLKSFNIGRVAFAITAALLSIAGTTQAQQSSPSPTPANGQSATPENAQLQQVTVTGYLVPRIGDGPQPVETLDQQFFKEQGDQTVADVLQRLPQNDSSFSPALNVPGKASRRQWQHLLCSSRN